VEAIRDINIKELTVSLIARQYIQWKDERLAFSSSSSIDQFSKDNFILASAKSSSIWTP